MVFGAMKTDRIFHDCGLCLGNDYDIDTKLWNANRKSHLRSRWPETDIK